MSREVIIDLETLKNVNTLCVFCFYRILHIYYHVSQPYILNNYLRCCHYFVKVMIFI